MIVWIGGNGLGSGETGVEALAETRRKIDYVRFSNNANDSRDAVVDGVTTGTSREVCFDSGS